MVFKIFYFCVCYWVLCFHFIAILCLLPEQDVPTDFVSTSEATLKDYDAYLKSLEENGKLTTQQYEAIETKIKDAIADMKKATTLEAAQDIYDEIEKDIYLVAAKDTSVNDNGNSKIDDTEVDKLEEAVATVKTNKEIEQERVTELLNKYLEVSKTMEGLTAHDKGVISDLVSGALEEVNNAKTAKEVQGAESKFNQLLVDGEYTELKAEVERQTAILQAQKETYKILDAYESALNNMTDFADRAKVQNAIDAARRNIKNAEKASEIIAIDDDTGAINGGIIDEFVKYIERNYDAMSKPAAKTLLDNELEEALETLESYKTGAYADEKDPDDRATSPKTIADLVDEYIEDVQEAADIPSKDLTVNSYKAVESELKTAVKELDEKIAKIKKAAEKNQEAYMEAYRAAVEELKVYEDNAIAFNLTSEQLAYINSLISNTRGKIAEVTTAQEVVTAMTVFRNAVAEYYSDFDQHQIEEIKKIAVAKLEEYSDLSDEIDVLVNSGVEAVKSQTTVNGIQTELQKALDEINANIKEDQLATAKVEARAKFYVFLEDNDEDGEYSDEIHKKASEAIDAINAATNVRDVEHAVEDYMAQIDEELAKRGTSLAKEVKAAQEKAKEQIALYRELANTITDADKKQELLNTIKLYEDSILSKDATLSSIAKDEEALRDFIETFEVKLVSAKLNAIEYMKLVGQTYYAVGAENTNAKNIFELEDKYVTNGKLDYEKLIKDPYMAQEFEKAINSIKNAKKEEDITTNPRGSVVSSAIEIVKNALMDLNTMEGERAATRTKIINLKSTANVPAKAKEFLEDYCKKHLDTIDLKEYKADNTVFDKEFTNAETALKNYLNGEIRKEALDNLNVSNMNVALKDILTDNKAYDLDVNEYQKNISVTASSDGVGLVKGDIRIVKNYDKYGSEKTGYFITLAIKSDTAKSVIVRRYDNGLEKAATASKKMGKDKYLTIRFADETAVKNTKVVVEFYDEANLDGYTSTKKTPVQTITYDFSNLTLHETYAEFKAVPVK